MKMFFYAVYYGYRLFGTTSVKIDDPCCANKARPALFLKVPRLRHSAECLRAHDPSQARHVTVRDRWFHRHSLAARSSCLKVQQVRFATKKVQLVLVWWYFLALDDLIIYTSRGTTSLMVQDAPVRSVRVSGRGINLKPDRRPPVELPWSLTNHYLCRPYF